MEGDLWAALVEHEPPGITGDCSAADVRPNDHVAEEQPRAHKRLTAIAGRHAHDGVVWGIEAQSGGG
jgi:hypothetical protein